METLGNNGLIIITLIYTKRTIRLSGPMDEPSFFVCDRLILVLAQKGALTTRYPQIIWYARLSLKYTNMYLFTDKNSAMNLMGGRGVNQYPIGLILGSSGYVLPSDFLVCFAKFKHI